ncbi:phosphatidylinositol phosphatase PTPRQ-like [Acipenser ruthenus]|uniref:phosphatidylinositol phosphatase PTPRQ-like n=1 Tax=Acipenser ruthenus TaxID=7906 RepID=UPI0027416EE7|nr:phosphatidylinositol phosphatase PTPRQ-like [Acipenser ruthenus]
MFSVTARAADNLTDGDSVNKSILTKPDIISSLNVTSVNTTSISLSWTKPQGNSTSYRVQVQGTGVDRNLTANSESITVTDLTAGSLYTFSVTARAADNLTEGDTVTIIKYTSKCLKQDRLYYCLTNLWRLRIQVDYPDILINVYKGRVYKRLLTQVVLQLIFIQFVQAGNSEETCTLLVSLCLFYKLTISPFLARTEPDIISSLNVTSVNTTSISLSWTKPQGNSTSYRVQVQGTGVDRNLTANSESITVTDLTAGSLYTFSVTARAADNLTDGDSVNKSILTKPDIISSLNVTSVNTTSISLSWTKPQGNSTSYRVQVQGTGVDRNLTANSESITVTNLTAGSFYMFSVTARAADNLTDGDSVNKSILTKPDIISSLNVTSVNTTSISLSWTKPQGNSTSYRVQVQGTGVDRNLTANSESITVTDLTAGSLYTFSVTARAADNLTEGDTVTIIKYTSKCLKQDRLYYCLTNLWWIYSPLSKETQDSEPDIISSLNVTSVNTTSISLSWTKPQGNSTSYRVQVQGTGVDRNLTANSESITVTDLTAGSLYTFSVTARAADNLTDGDSVNKSILTKPDIISSLNVTSVNTTSISLSWTKPQGNSTSYRVQVQGTGVDRNLTANSESITVTNLTAGSFYMFSVTARAADNLTDGDSVNKSILTKPDIISSLNVTSVNTTSISLSWTKPQGNSTSYRVQVQGTGVDRNLTANSESITVTDLTAGSLYTFSVTARAADNLTEGDTVTIIKYTKPDIISSLNVTSVNTTSISLSWTKPQGNSTSYRVQVQGTGVDRNLTANSESITVTDLTAGSLYTFSVTARAADNLTDGDSVNKSILTKPDIISSLNVTSVNTTSISLSWTKPQGNSTSYRVQVQGTGVDRNLTANSESITVTDLTAGSLYTFSVTARAADNLTEGDTVTIIKYTSKCLKQDRLCNCLTNLWFPVRTLGLPRSEDMSWFYYEGCFSEETCTLLVSLCLFYKLTISPFLARTEPDIISSLNVTSVNTTSISLSWTKPQGNSTSYRVQVQGTGVDRNLTANSESITVTNLTAGSFYMFSVTARAADNLTDGDSVNKSILTKPDIISSLNVTSVNTTSISLSWTKPQGNSTSYRVQVQGTGVDRNLTANSESITVTDLTAGSLYTFSVTARAADNLTEGGTVTIIKYTSKCLKQDRLCNCLTNLWTKPQGNSTSYRVQVQGTGVDRNLTANSESITVTNLTAGSFYTFSVTARAADNLTEGDTVTIIKYTIAPFLARTEPDIISSLNVTSVNTTSISLSWTKPQGNSTSYRVQVQGTGVDRNLTANSESITVTDLTAGSLYTFSVTARAADNLTEGDTVSITKHTKPDIISSLNVTSVNTTSISLSWTKPQGNSTSYRIQVQGAGVNRNLSANSESITVTNLTAGSLYTFNVTARAADNLTEGEYVAKSSYTKPEKISTVILVSSEPKNSSMLVNWSAPAGNVETYEVNINGSFGDGQTTNVTTNTTSFRFDGLRAGRIYSATVTTISGPFRVQSGVVQNATYPNAPGSISNDSKTTSSISLRWGSPVSMDPNSFNFSVTYSSNASDSKTLVTTNTSVQLSNLQSGTLYNMSVVTNGVMGFQSAAVTQSTSTRPNTVQDLKANSISTTSIELKWGKPQDYKTGYKYRVQASNSSGGVAFNTVVNSENATVSALEAGTWYNLTVTTLTSDYTDGTSSAIIIYTRPTTVTNLKAAALNSTAVNLTWARPADFKPGYSYRLQTTGPAAPQNVTVTVENAIITGLTPGTNFSFSAFTRAADNTTEGDPATTTSYTKPEKITTIILVSSEPKNSSMLVNWAAPAGNVETYEVNISSSFGDGQTKNVTTNTTSFRFDGLRAGRIYSATVTTISGPFRVQSGVVQNATYPNAPGSISNDSKTNSSISLSWGSPVSMDPNSFNFSVTYSSNASDSKTLVTTNTNVQLSNLQSGTLYNMSVVTNGVMGFQSAAVTQSTSTRPNTVQDLNASSISTTSIELKWGKPQDYKTGYKYRVQGQNSSGGVVFNTIVNSENATVSPLETGTRYNLTVTTLTSDYTDGTSSAIIIYTRPNAVKNLNTSDVSTSDVVLGWIEPDEKKDYYRYLLKTTAESSSTQIANMICNKTSCSVSNLTPGSSYTFTVFTLTPDNTTSDPQSLTQCTTAESVQVLNCTGEDKKPILTFQLGCPKGSNKGFEILNNNTNAVEYASFCNGQTTGQYTMSNLNYFTTYHIEIKTLGCGKNSTVLPTDCQTGKTDPPEPPANTTVLFYKMGTHETITFEFNSAIFDEKNGPITNYAVIVTTNTDQIRPLNSVLGKTYNDKDTQTKSYVAKIINNTGSRAAETKQNVVIGDESSYQDYYNGKLTPKEGYRVSIAGFTKLVMKNQRISQEESLISCSPYSQIIYLSENPAVIGAAVGGTLGVLVVLILITVILFVYWKRRSPAKTSDIHIPTIRPKTSHPIKVEHYEAYYKKQHADSNCGFAEEFEDLRPIGINQTKNAALAPDNKVKNRYNNVLPYDSSRVKLSMRNSASDDYINANYMPGYDSKKKFIAAQGPLPGTVNDFWRMIWEQNVYTLVMLTRCNEQGRVKCEEYWPSSNPKTYGDVTVILTSEIPLNEWTIREFKMKNTKTAESRTVRHFHFTAWPDHGVPETTELLINFRHLVREHMDQYSRNSPTVVHCSAGVGRTGTLIAIDQLIYQIERESVVDIYGIVHNLRMHRPLMVQTEDQYIFLNQCAKDFIRSRTGNNVDLIYQNTAAMGIYENFTPTKTQNGHHC